VLRYLLEKSYHHHDAAAKKRGTPPPPADASKSQSAPGGGAKVLPDAAASLDGASSEAPCGEGPPGEAAPAVPRGPRLSSLRPLLKRVLMLLAPASAEPAFLQGRAFDAGAFGALAGAVARMLDRWVDRAFAVRRPRAFTPRQKVFWRFHPRHVPHRRGWRLCGPTSTSHPICIPIFHATPRHATTPHPNPPKPTQTHPTPTRQPHCG
jgi:hypothetical protein